jgi:hypothetical protein
MLVGPEVVALLEGPGVTLGLIVSDATVGSKVDGKMVNGDGVYVASPFFFLLGFVPLLLLLSLRSSFDEPFDGPFPFPLPCVLRDGDLVFFLSYLGDLSLFFLLDSS